MVNQIKHLLNMNEQRLIILGGIPGSGKSTLASEFEKVGYKIICPDTIRFIEAKKIVGNENKSENELQDILMKMSKKAFEVSHTLILDYISQGYSIVFDATQTSKKSRKQIIQWAKEANINPIAVYIECPLETALQRNIERASTVINTRDNGEKIYGRYVPSYVIENKWTKQTLPLIKEGFQEVNILHVDLNMNRKISDIKEIVNNLRKSNDIEKTLQLMYNDKLLFKILPSLHKCWDFNQDNKNHNLPLHMHMIKAAEYLKNESLELFIAGLLHDVGKLVTKKNHGKILYDTKQFKIGEKVEVKYIKEKEGFIIAYKLDYKGERSELLTIKHVEINNNANYYEHQLIGAIMVKRELIELGFDKAFTNKIYEYILHHMDLPFEIASKKTLIKIINNIGTDIIDDIIKLREADKNGSNGDKYLSEIHSPNVLLINNIVNRKG